MRCACCSTSRRRHRKSSPPRWRGSISLPTARRRSFPCSTSACSSAARSRRRTARSTRTRGSCCASMPADPRAWRSSRRSTCRSTRPRRRLARAVRDSVGRDEALVEMRRCLWRLVRLEPNPETAERLLARVALIAQQFERDGRSYARLRVRPGPDASRAAELREQRPDVATRHRPRARRILHARARRAHRGARRTQRRMGLRTRR